MLTIIAFIVTVLGSANWLMIGLLQYDFIAGIFGFQASVFSRIIYIIFGLACGILVFKLFKGKGSIPVFTRRNKKDLEKSLAKIGNKNREKEGVDRNYSHANIESTREFTGNNHFENTSEIQHSHKYYDEYDENEKPLPPPRSLFDEHFDERGEK